jgi:radical SAM/Cys-rich protein
MTDASPSPHVEEVVEPAGVERGTVEGGRSCAAAFASIRSLRMTATTAGLKSVKPISLRINGGPARGSFAAAVKASQPGPLVGATLDTVQVNIGLTCNLACRHCHVTSGPKRQEQMSRETQHMVLHAAKRAGAKVLDITGGAPEMNPHFREFVDDALAIGLQVMVRTNLTIQLVDGYTDLPEWYAKRKVHLVASLPCYLENNVDKQRGRGVYHDSIEVVQKLNAQGYGVDPELPLFLVFNPGGPKLPPPQEALGDDYRRELGEQYGIKFTSLLTITNMPIGRFLHDLERDGKAEEYENLLRNSFNAATLDGLMCRHQIHVSYDGSLHDCDFNYALGLKSDRRSAQHISDFDPATYRERRIVLGDHCYGCTAGSGSSCGGSVA